MMVCQKLISTQKKLIPQTMKETKFGRRRFLSSAAMSISSAQVAMFGFNNLLVANDYNNRFMNGNFDETMFDIKIKQIEAGVLNIGYSDEGPSNGTPVILLHGWPYDIHSYAEVSSLLSAKG